MKKLYFLIIALLAINSAMAQGCLPNGITFSTQGQINNFQSNYPGCTEIEGDVTIEESYSGAILNLNGLSVITAIGGNLVIENNNSLSHLAGLENLISIGKNLDISINNSLTSLAGLGNLTSVGGDDIFIYGNNSLLSISALSGLTIINGNLLISYTALTKLTGLQNVTEIHGDCRIEENSDLNSLTGLDNLTSIGGWLNIEGSNLTNLSGLDNLNSIAGDFYISDNPELVSLTGLENLKLIGGVFYIVANNSLPNFTGLSSLEFLFGDLYIVYNNSLNSLIGLEKLTSIGSAMYITENNSLKNLTGLEKLSSIEGLYVYNSDTLTSLKGLEGLTTIGRSLTIDNNGSLASLTGLEGLISIGQGMNWDGIHIVDNNELTNLLGLSNVTSVKGSVYIGYYGTNSKLASLAGLDNIDDGTIDSLFISNNPLLSTCEVQCICDYLASPNGTTVIENNASGCNNTEEVIIACQIIGIQNIIQENKLSIFPNPSSNRFTIQFSLENEEQVKLFVLNNLGQVVAIVANETLSEGQHELNWNAEGMPAGVHFYNIQIGNQAGTGKMVLMK